MKKIGDILREMMEESRLGWRGFAEKVGLETSTLTHLFALGDWGRTRPSTIQNLAGGMGMPVEKFLQEVERRRQPRPFTVHTPDPARAPTSGIKLRNRTEAGPGSAYRVDDYEHGIYSDEYLPTSLIPHTNLKLGAMIVSGESMLPKFHPGDLIIVAESRLVESGDYVVVGFHNGQHELKQIQVIDNQTWDLVPLNKEGFSTRRVTADQIAWHALVLFHGDNIFRRWPKSRLGIVSAAHSLTAMIPP